MLLFSNVFLPTASSRRANASGSGAVTTTMKHMSSGSCGESLTRKNVTCRLAHSPWAMKASIHGSKWKSHIGLAGNKGQVGRLSVQTEYIDALLNSQIIVTVNPNSWEGDSRLGEALASGAVVLVDRMVDPPPQYVHGRHLYYYDSIPHLFELLEHVVSSPEEADRVAAAGRRAARTFSQLAQEMVAAVLAQSTLKPPVRLFLDFQGRPGGADGYVVDALASLARSLVVFVAEYAEADVVVLPLWGMFAGQQRSRKAFEAVMHDRVATAATARKLILAYDWHDGPELLPAAALSDPKRVHFYFKRSRVIKRNGWSHSLFNYSRPVFPMYYAVFENKLSMINALNKLSMINAHIDTLLPRSHRPTNLSCFF